MAAVAEAPVPVPVQARTEGVTQPCRDAVAGQVLAEHALVTGIDREARIDRVIETCIQIDLVVAGRDRTDGERTGWIAIEVRRDPAVLVIQIVTLDEPPVRR